MRPTFHTLTLATILLVGTAQAAPSTSELRYFGLDVTAPAGANRSSSNGHDAFNNGDPYTGIVYERNFNQPSLPGGYVASTFTPGAEKTGAASDFAGTQFGVGSLSFRRGDAIETTNNLSPANTKAYSTILRPAVVPNTALGLANKSDGFHIVSVWNYAPLQAGESIAMVLGGTNGPNYTDRINLAMRSDYATGQTGIFFEQQSAIGSTISRATLGSIALSDIYANLSDVDYFGLSLDRAAPSGTDLNPGVKATIAFFDAALGGNGDLLQLAQYTFDATAYSFGPNTSGFAGMFMSASWIEATTAPIPEPGTWALMALGLAALGVAARRRRA